MAKKITITKKVTVAGKELEVGTTLSVSDPLAKKLLDGKEAFAELFVQVAKKVKAEAKKSSEKKED